MAALAAALVEKSVYFTVEPLPDDGYRISVKPDVFHLLEKSGVSELERMTICGVPCFFDSRLEQLRPVGYPEIVISMKEEDYPTEFKALPEYVDKKNAIEDLLNAAKAHGEDSDPDHEVGDLQDILRTCFVVMEDDQAREVIEEHADKLELYI